MKKHFALGICSLLIAVFAASCSNDTPSPTDPGGPGGGGDPKPNPDGVLLDGDGTNAARSALEPLPPSPVESGDIFDDDVLATRLIAYISPSATVAEINTALESQGARIVTMDKGNPFVTLKVPRLENEQVVETITEGLSASGAFGYVGLARTAQSSTVAQIPVPPSKDGVINMAVDHLQRSRMLTAWNAQELAIDNNDDITVLVPDEYISTLPHVEIDAQSFSGFGAPLSLPGLAIFPGNNGFVVSGIIGANYDETPVTGSSPSPDALMDVVSMPLGGLTWTDIFWMLGFKIATGDDRQVLNTGLVYNDPNFIIYSPFDRAMHVIAWRVTAALHYSKFLHVTAAGDAVDFELNSPFIAAALFNDVRDMVDFSQLSPEDSTALETAWTDLNNSFAIAATAAPNVLIVGSVDGNGVLSNFSAQGDVQMLGENVTGPCVNQDPAFTPGLFCDGEIAVYSGTSISTAQVSGLAAFMMNLSDASPSAIRDMIVASNTQSQDGGIDAYDAVLKLDDGEPGDIRRALLDVAGFQSPDPDGDFDDYDLEALASLASSVAPDAELQRSADPIPALIRLDLNGDGLVSGLGTRRFDLDADGSYGTVIQNIEDDPTEFDENNVTDGDVVCYYAYSDIYNGDVDRRRDLVAPAHSGVVVEILGFPSRVGAEEPFDVAIRAGLKNDAGVQYIEGIELNIDVDGGDYTNPGGENETGPGGTLTIQVTLDKSSNVLTLGVEAETGDDTAYTEKSALRHNEIEYITREVEVNAGVFFNYCTEQGVVCPQVVNTNLFDFIPDTTEPYDKQLDRPGNGSGSGMTVSGTAKAMQRSSIDVTNGTDFSGFRFEADVEGSINLSNPNFDILFYQAEGEGWAGMCVEFNVWGEGAMYNLSGSLSGSAIGEYYVELDGDENIYLCDYYDSPCSSVNSNGFLPPGEYDIFLFAFAGGHLRWNENCTDCPDRSGSRSNNSEMDITFSINPSGGAASSESLADERVLIRNDRTPRRAAREQRRARLREPAMFAGHKP